MNVIRYFLLLVFFNTAFSNEIAVEKKTFEEEITQFNENLALLKKDLSEKYAQVSLFHKEKVAVEKYSKLLKDVQTIKENIKTLQNKCRDCYVKSSNQEEDAFAFWDQGETTLSQLIMEYGANEYLYIIPYELSNMKIDMLSTIPIPKESWQEMIELILSQNGIGVKKVNPFLRQLYIVKHDLTNVDAIASCEEDLELIPDNSLVFYVFSPNVEQLNNVRSFFERFSDPKITTIQVIGSKLVIVSRKESVDKLVKLYAAAWDDKQTKIVKILSSTKINVTEIEKILKSFFIGSDTKGRPSFYPSVSDELFFLPLPNGSSIAVVGEERKVDRAEEIVRDIEKQLEDPSETCISWYTCKHSEPDDLAYVLDRVYISLFSANSLVGKKEVIPPPPDPPRKGKHYDPQGPAFERHGVYNPVLPVTPLIAEPGRIDHSPPKNYNNFIVDNKTGSILMVVRRDLLPKIKAILKKLDVPKRMAQIDVLLVEKKLTDRKQTGINLLKIGTASGKRETAISFDTKSHAHNKGILEFILSRTKGALPAFDLAFNFLMAQDDICINANPSIVAINNTPATISIVEELSINNGAIQLDTVNGVTVEKSYTRAQYGITLVLTPTIHLPILDEDDSDYDKGFVSLKTDVSFDTTQTSDNDRPPVCRRLIQNEVRIADGETVILGGLRKKIEEDVREKIPFLGDIPGIGKLFGTTKLNDISTEMFIFITPKIISDPVEGMRKIRQQEISLRAGDLPEFYEKVEKSKDAARRKLFHNSLKLIFDKS